MVQLIGTIAFGLAAAGFVRWGEPIIGCLLVVCAIVWIATALLPGRPDRAPSRGGQLRLE
ncbi:MAG: hypothetical protein JSR90_09925 [Proteobacteria bacterium]|nr:hypothetical protein [Pseudomonadota bacterium]